MERASALLLLSITLQTLACAAAVESSVSVTILSSQPITAFSRFEAEIGLPPALAFQNPFDPQEISVQATFTASSGLSETVAAFWYQNYSRSLDSASNEVLTPVGSPSFLLRYAPTVPGDYALIVKASTNASTASSGTISFSVVARSADAPADGFVRVSANRVSFYRDATQQQRGMDLNRRNEISKKKLDNAPVYPLYLNGLNICWGGGNTTYEYDVWFGELAANGGNYARIWLQPFDSFTVENTGTGLGRYSLPDLWRIDYVLQLAERLGIYVMFCQNSFNEIRTSSPDNMWTSSPYNAANGGPLTKPFEYFTNPIAIAYWQQRQQYLVARFAYSTHLMSWELWNEVDLGDDVKANVETVAAWHANASDFIRSIDVYRHLVTTSCSDSDGLPELDSLPQISYTQTHNYNSLDFGYAENAIVAKKVLDYGKPHYFGEFGLDWPQQENNDPRGISLHNGMWASLGAGAAGTAMLWWWDLYVFPNSLQSVFQPLAAFTEGVPFHQLMWQQANVTILNGTYPDIPVLCGSPFAACKAGMRVTGVVDPNEMALLWLQNMNNTWLFQLATPPAPLETFPPTAVRLHSLKSGDWTVNWFDTYSGSTIGSSVITVGSSKHSSADVDLVTPPFTQDIACKLSFSPSDGEAVAAV